MKQLHDVLIAWCMHANTTHLSLYNIYICFSVRSTLFLLFICIYDSVSKQLSDPLHIRVWPLSVRGAEKHHVCPAKSRVFLRNIPNERQDTHFSSSFFFLRNSLSTGMSSDFTSTTTKKAKIFCKLLWISKTARILPCDCTWLPKGVLQTPALELRTAHGTETTTVKSSHTVTCDCKPQRKIFFWNVVRSNTNHIFPQLARQLVWF